MKFVMSHFILMSSYSTFMESSAKAKINVSEVCYLYSMAYEVLVIHSLTFFVQIFYDLVRQINSKTPEKPEKKKKSRCLVL